MDQPQRPTTSRSETLPLEYSSRCLWGLTGFCLQTPRFGWDGRAEIDRTIRRGIPPILSRIHYTDIETDFSSVADYNWRHVMVELMDLIRQRWEVYRDRTRQVQSQIYGDVGGEILFKWIYGLFSTEESGTKATQAVAAIMYDQQCCKVPPCNTQIYPDELDSTPDCFDTIAPWSWPIKHPAIDAMLEQHLLLVDYMPYLPAEAADTFDIWKNTERALKFLSMRQTKGRLPSDDAWRFFTKIIDLFSVPFGIPGQSGDWVLSLLYYDQYRNKDPNFTWDPSASYSSGKATPYNGALQAMVSEIPTIGTSSRLLRKLSTDVNVRIPARIHDPFLRREMTMIAERLAAENGLPSLYKSEIPYVYAKPRRGKAQSEEKVMTSSSEVAKDVTHKDDGETKKSKSLRPRPLDGVPLVTDADIEGWEYGWVSGEGE